VEKRILEVCVDSLESALAAKQGGADRLELCSGLVVGGLTPSPALFDAVREETGLPVNVLIRPRFGDFLYTSGELEIMARDMAYFAQRGASGLVTGALRPDGRLDRGAMGELLAAAGGRPVTLHRAFDVCRDPRETMELAFALGVGTILTSGQQADAWTGRDLIGELLDRAEGRGDILIGGGMNATVIRDFRRSLPLARCFHMSGKEVLDSGMTFRNPRVSMGLPGISEFQVWRTGEDAVREAAKALKKDI